MFYPALEQAVVRLATSLARSSDTDLGRAWPWRDYTEEGVRFTAFVAIGQLRELAAQTRATQPVRIGQQLLAFYHAAYRDLEAVLLGVDGELASRTPAPESWSVLATLRHMLEADLGFYGLVRINLDRYQTGSWSDAPLTNAEYDAALGPEEAIIARLQGDFAALQAYHREIHERALGEFAGLSDQETELPSRFWEQECCPLSFRLQRFDAHLRQHTIQVEQVLHTLGHAMGEGRLLARQLFAALADAETPLIGRATLPSEYATVSAAINDLAEQAELVLA